MARLLRIKIVEEILRVGLVPVFYNDDPEIAFEVARACLEGGARLVEFTNRGDRAHDVFNRLSMRCETEIPDSLLGAGTVIDPCTAAQYINSGANFIVGPSFNPEVAKICNRRKILYIPGCQTPSEISDAEELGADVVKLFPASSVTHKFVRDLMGPSPHSLVMPSGGIGLDQKEIQEWIKAGAVALNLGSALIRKDLMTNRRFNEIREGVKHCIQWIDEAKAGRSGAKVV
jgi:2-dehydro-3-deoxyphosphogluconate aldolase/(4S)-4-hydroxy-2-oxoglutarate aldolase